MPDKDTEPSGKTELAIQPYTLAEAGIIDHFLDDAYGKAGGRVDDLKRYLELQPDGWFAGRLDDRIVGSVGAQNYGPFAWIGMMAVHSSMRRRGFGAQLMQYLLNWLEVNNCALSLLDATTDGEPLYRRFGFVEDDRAHKYTFAADTPLVTPAPHTTELLTLADLPATARFDVAIFGADRSALFRILLRDFPQRGFVSRETNGEINGFIFAQSHKLGPWAASSFQVAEALLQRALTLDYRSGPTIIVPAANPDAARLFKRYAFHLELDLSHMRRGGTHNPCRRELIYGQTSFAIG